MAYQNQVLGTIISSVLNYDELCSYMGEQAVVNSKSTYAPCDGRSIVGSQLERHTNHAIKNAPDLRGKFQRGLNIMYDIGQPLPFEAAKYGDPQPNRSVMGYQQDVFEKHSHSYKQFDGSAGHDFRGTGYGAGSTNTSESGGDETRPRNIAVYFYIKIN